MSYVAHNIYYQYPSVLNQTDAFELGPLNFSIPSGKITFICGRSGSGKSTLLAILGLLRTEFQGQLTIGELKAQELIVDKSILYKYRLENIGFALQKGRLLPYLSVKENSEFILDYLNYSTLEIAKKSSTVFEKLFKIEKDEGEATFQRVLNSLPEEVSGGQYQRAAMARALINSPQIILADEPTGNLDVDTGEKTMELLKSHFSERKDSTIIIVSHDLEYARLYADKIIILKKGQVSAQIEKNENESWLTSGKTLPASGLMEFLNAKIKDDE